MFSQLNDFFLFYEYDVLFLEYRLALCGSYDYLPVNYSAKQRTQPYLLRAGQIHHSMD